MRGNVVDLAIAVVIGVAFGAVVAALVSDFLTALIAEIFGKPDFSALTFTIHRSKFLYGHFVNELISFLSVAAAVYFIVVVPMTKIAERRKRGVAEAKETAMPSDEAILLAKILETLERTRA